MQRDTNARQHDPVVQCLELQTSPVHCFIPMTDVLEILEDGRHNSSPVHLEGLGLLESELGTGKRLIRFRAAPAGPHLALSSPITSSSVNRAAILPLPTRAFPNSLYSGLVLIDGQPAGLMLDVPRYVERHAGS